MGDRNGEKRGLRVGGQVGEVAGYGASVAVGDPAAGRQPDDEAKVEDGTVGTPREGPEALGPGPLAPGASLCPASPIEASRTPPSLMHVLRDGETLPQKE